MGKTYTVDPISKRRLDNHGESNKYYTKNHHEAIISEEEWDKVQDILKADIVLMKMYQMRRESSLQENTLLAVCVSVVSVELISPDVPIIRIQSIKSRYGNAGRQRIRELQTAHIAKP